MTAILGFAIIFITVLLILKKIMNPLPAFIIVPVLCAVIGGYGETISDIIVKGIYIVAPIGVMFIFATLFFGVILTAGTLKPYMNFFIRAAGRNPIKICVGLGLLTFLVHTSGSGAVTYMLLIPPMISIFDMLGMRRITLTTIIGLSAGLQNTQPWGATAQRCMAAFQIGINDLWIPLVVPLGVGMCCIVCIDGFLGWQEKRRIPVNKIIFNAKREKENPYGAYERPGNIMMNSFLVVATLEGLVSGYLSSVAVFMIAFSVALLINYPNPEDQKFIISHYAKNALTMSGVVFATGVLVGILNETGMITAMAYAIATIIPESMGIHLPLIMGIASVPASLIFDPSSFYFGVLPVLAEVGNLNGVDTMSIVRAAFLGQMNMGFPFSPLTGSTFVLLGLSGVSLADHQKHTLPWAFLVTLIMLSTAVFTGSINL
ncbi:MAG: citrate:proton symporter [Caecibacter massiliensis]|nr:citrate:proton symporter [Caecibacter massiliensis]